MPYYLLSSTIIQLVTFILLDKFKISGPPVHPLQELLRLNQIVEINQE